jgi:hypothetical protein
LQVSFVGLDLPAEHLRVAEVEDHVGEVVLGPVAGGSQQGKGSGVRAFAQCLDGRDRDAEELRQWMLALVLLSRRFEVLRLLGFDVGAQGLEEFELAIGYFGFGVLAEVLDRLRFQPER